MSVSLKRLKEVIDGNFGEPYLPEGLVQTRWLESPDGRQLEIRIGRRDVCLMGNGKTAGSGTRMFDKDRFEARVSGVMKEEKET